MLLKYLYFVQYPLSSLRFEFCYSFFSFLIVLLLFCYCLFIYLIILFVLENNKVNLLPIINRCHAGKLVFKSLPVH